MKFLLKLSFFIFLICIFVNESTVKVFGKLFGTIWDGICLVAGGTYEWFAELAKCYPYGFAFLIICTFFWLFSKK